MPKIIDDHLIYQAVISVVSEYGYSGATTKMMAEKAGISEVTLFRKYGNKRLLIKKAASSIINQTSLASGVKYTGDVYKDLVGVVEAYQQSAVRYGDFITTLFSEISRNPELIDSIEEPFSIFQAIAEVVANYQNEGCLKLEPPLYAVATLLGPVMYSSMLRRFMAKNQLPPLDPHEHVKSFLSGREI